MYALVICDVASQIDQKPKIPNFLKEVETATMNDESSSKICGNTWLIDLNTDLLLFRHLLDLADGYTVPYKISYFETKPEFI